MASGFFKLLKLFRIAEVKGPAEDLLLDIPADDRTVFADEAVMKFLGEIKALSADPLRVPKVVPGTAMELAHDHDPADIGSAATVSADPHPSGESAGGPEDIVIAGIENILDGRHHALGAPEKIRLIVKAQVLDPLQDFRGVLFPRWIRHAATSSRNC